MPPCWPTSQWRRRTRAARCGCGHFQKQCSGAGSMQCAQNSSKHIITKEPSISSNRDRNACERHHGCARQHTAALVSGQCEHGTCAAWRAPLRLPLQSHSTCTCATTLPVHSQDAHLVLLLWRQRLHVALACSTAARDSTGQHMQLCWQWCCWVCVRARCAGSVATVATQGALAACCRRLLPHTPAGDRPAAPSCTPHLGPAGTQTAPAARPAGCCLPLQAAPPRAAAPQGVAARAAP
jgi:hypothetical protein